MKFRTVLLVAIAVVIFGALSMAQPLQLAFWGGWTGPDGNVMRQLVAEYNSTHPNVHVTLTTMQWTPLFTKFLVSSRGGQSPNILAMHGPDVPEFASYGLLTPISDVLQAAGFSAKDFAPAAWNGTFYNGKQYAFPLDLHMNSIYYNKKLFEKAGITPPTGWISGKEFLNMAIKLTVDKNGKHPGEAGFDPNNIVQYGIALYSLNWHGFLEWYELLRQEGYNFLNPSMNKIGYPLQAGEKAWKWLQDLFFKYHVAPVGANSPLQDFLIGKTAMLEDGPWEIPAMKAQKGLEWGTFPVPQVFAHKAVWGSGHVLTIPVHQDKAHMKAAEDFVIWLIKHSDKWALSGNIPAYNSARKYASSLVGRNGFLKEAEYVAMLPRIPKESQVFSSASVSPIVVAGQNILVRNQNIMSVMKWMNQQINMILAQ
ncbi:extracellular solute-binding protein [Mesoaciditoga sp.]